MSDAITERAYLVERALSWVGTPYHHMGQLKHVGVDCAMLLYRVWLEAGFIGSLEIEDYPADWHLNRAVERYSIKLLDFCHEMPLPEKRAPLPADIMLFKFGRAFSHGVIITNYPHGIHAVISKGVLHTNVLEDPMLNCIMEKSPDRFKPRQRRVFCFDRWL